MGDRKAGSENFHADADQVADVLRYAAPYGAKVEFLPPERMSGGKPIEQRPSLKAAIEGVESGKYTGLITANLKRLTRSRSGLAIWDRVEGAGGSVHCAAENLDTSTPNGRFVRDIHLADAVREREEHVERFDRRRKGATASGIWQRRQTPTGYKKSEDRRLVPDDDAEKVLDAFRGYRNGAAIVALADRLGMTPNGVRRLLRNRVYVGELRVGRYVNKDAHPAIVPLELFEAVQARLESRSRPARSPKVDGVSGLLVGVVRCASCGHRMTRKRSKGVSGFAYACPTLHSGERCPAPAAIETSRLEGFVEPIAMAELDRLQTAAQLTDRTAEIRVAVDDARRRRQGLLDAFDPDDAGAEALVEAVRKHTARIEELEARLMRELNLSEVLPEQRSGSAAYLSLSVQGRNTVLRGLLAAVVVSPAGRGGRTLPVATRARVLAHGAPVALPERSGGVGMGIHPVVVNPGDPGVLLGVLGG